MHQSADISIFKVTKVLKVYFLRRFESESRKIVATSKKKKSKTKSTKVLREKWFERRVTVLFSQSINAVVLMESHFYLLSIILKGFRHLWFFCMGRSQFGKVSGRVWINELNIVRIKCAKFNDL